MKKIFVLITFVIATTAEGQQILSNNFYGKEKPDTKKSNLESSDDDKKEITHFKILGVGNISDETLKNINAGGKAVFAFSPNPLKTKWQSNYFVSFNKNATNTDSALSTTLIFPESGNHSFLMHSFWKSISVKNKNVYKGLFLEFALKKITNKKDTSDPKFQEFTFNTLHYTAGYKWGFSKEKIKDDKTQSMGCEFAVFCSFANIPDEDHDDFEKIINRPSTNNSFGMLGFKVSFEVNGFQIFSDIRQVFGNKDRLPVADLKGFNYNIGVSFNTEVFNF